MCGRYVLKREDLETLLRQFGLSSLEEFRSRYNIAPTSIVPLIRERSPGVPELAGVRWGLIPAWTKADRPVRPLVNVRAETLVAKSGGVLRSRRCVLPASGFYEWHATGTKKQPWLFCRRDGGGFGLAAIWDTWRGPDGVEFDSCAVVTTTPNRTLARVHDRMPVMLTPEQCRQWVATTQPDPASLQALLASAPDDSMTALKVGPAVSNVRNDGPECLAAAVEGGEDAAPQLSFGF
jgi:putative SOS response-associated peptidase YedK